MIKRIESLVMSFTYATDYQVKTAWYFSTKNHDGIVVELPSMLLYRINASVSGIE